ncbi:retrovirus-related pol polyprotein from transposon TNT 1-94 [Tanacetum coccineum]
MEQMTSICDMVGQYMQKKEEDRQIAEDQAAKDRYWKIPICYDDDDDEESSIPLKDIITSRLPPCELNQEIFQRDNSVSNQSAPSFDQLFELNELKAQSQEKDMVIKKLKERIKSLSGKLNEDKIKKDLEEIETINIKLDHRVSKLIAENEHLKQTYKQLYDSIKPSRIRSKEQCDDLINQVNLKSTEISDLNASLQEKVLVITALKDDLKKLKRKALVDNAVMKHTIDPKMLKIDVEPITPKLLNKKTAHSAYIKHTQEEATVLKDLVEQVKSKYPLDHSLKYACRGVKPFTSASGSQPSGNTKKDKIQQTPSSTQKNKVEAHPRRVKPSLKNKDCVVAPKGTANVQHSKLNANSELKCVKCNSCKLSDNHDLPTGQTFTIVGNACPLTRITTTTEVPLRKPTVLDNEIPKPVVTLVYSRKPRKSKTNVPASKSKVVQIVLWYLDSGCSKHMTGDRSQLTNFVNKFLGTVKFGNDHVAKILGYGDYQIGNVTISRVYYVNDTWQDIGIGDYLIGSATVQQQLNVLLTEWEEGFKVFWIRPNLEARVNDTIVKMDIGVFMETVMDHVRCLFNISNGFNILRFTCLCFNGVDEDLMNLAKVYDLPYDAYYMCLDQDFHVEVILKKYILIIVDDYSHNGTEFVNQTLREYYEKVGISHETSVARSPRQNSVVERRNRTQIEVASTMLIYAKAPLFLWAEAVATAWHSAIRQMIVELWDKVTTESCIGFFMLCTYKRYKHSTCTFENGLYNNSSGLVAKPPSFIHVCSTFNELDWDILFQPLFDELLNPSSSVDCPAPEVIAPIAEVVAPEHAASTKDNHDLDVAHMNNDPFFGIPIPENDSEASSSSDVISTVVHTAAPNSEHVNKWTKDHPLDNIIGELERPVSTRLQLHEQALFCYYDAFLTSVKPKNYKDALTQACWI